MTRRARIHRSAEQWIGIVDALPIAVAVIGRNGQIDWVNAQTELLFGYSEAELQGEVIETLLPLRFRASHASLREQFSNKLRASAQPEAREFVGLRKDGSEFPLQIELSAPDSEDNCCTLVSITDISERKRAEAIQRGRKDLLSMFMEHAPVAIAMFDLDMRYIMASRRWSSDYRLGNRNLRGLCHYDLFPEIPERWREAHRRGLSGEILGAQGERFERADGTVQLVDWEIRPWYSNGRQGGIIIFTEDVTYRIAAETRFRDVVETASTAMVMADTNGTIVMTNRELERLFGYDRNELLGRKAESLLPPRLRAAHEDLRRGFYAAPKPLSMRETDQLFGLRRDGSEFPMEVAISPVRTHEGVFVLSVVVDISARKRAESSQRLAMEALERSNMELQRFAYAASHDLQTPMRSIASFVQLLQHNYADVLDQRGCDWLRRTFESVKQLQSLIRDLLEYSQIDANAHPFAPVPFRQVFDDTLHLLDASIRDSGAQISCGDLPVVQGDRTQLVQLLLNLIGNALKYRRSEPLQVNVAAEHSSGDWLFSVRDNGIGIAKRYQSRIFEPFQRLHHQREIPGTGMGLAICSRVVHRHGGKLWVESEPGRGSIFYFTIPEEARRP